MFNMGPLTHRCKMFFELPKCYFGVIRIKECKRSLLGIAFDLIKLFYDYKTFPDHYVPCRLWEVEKTTWKYYYGSNYQSYQRSKLQRRVQPPEYRILFDDKAICERLCRETGVSMPHTFGIINPDQNYRERILSWLHNSGADSVIIKPLLGSGGRGIVLANRQNNNILIQSIKGPVPLQDFNLAEVSIVQEVVKQDRRMSTFSSSSVNTIRVVTMYTKTESIIVLGATMRCGIGESYVDNWSAGGVAVGINCRTGHLSKYAYDKKGNRYINHPTSKALFEGFIIPEWKSIIDVALIIQKAFPCYRILGMDIALQENGEPMLIEVNDSPDLLFQEQTSGPLLQVEQNLRSFGEYDLLVNRHQKKLYDSLSSQRSL